MTKYFTGFFVAVFLIINLPSTFANENPNTVNLKSQTRLWLTDRSSISFTLEETSGSGISNAEIEISKTALLGRSAIRAIIKKPNSIEYASIFETATVEQSENLFTFTMPGSKWQFSGAGTYALRLTVYVRGEAQKVTSFISFLPKSIQLNKLRVSTVLPLVVNSGLTPNNLVLNDVAANTFVDGAGLSSVLSVGAEIKNVTWLLDSDTLRLAQSIGAGSAIAHPEAHESLEEQIAGAQSWLDQLPIAVNSQNTFVIPTGNVDVLALKSANFNRIANLAISDAQYVFDYFGGLNLQKITVAPLGDYSNFGFEWLKSKQVEFNLLNSNAYPAQSSTYTPNGVVQDGLGNKGPVVDQYASKLFSDAIGKETNPGMYQAAFAADLLITALEQPALNRFLVLLPDTNQVGLTSEKFASAVSAISAPWIESVRVSNFKNAGIGSRNRESVTSKLDRSTKDLIRYARSTKSNLSSLITGAIEETQIDFAIMRAGNVVADSKTSSHLKKQTALFIDQLNDAVRIMSAGSVIFPNENAKVPITVRNDLSVPIKIHIETSGLPAVRVIPGEVEDMQIAPGRRKSIEIPTRLIGTDTAYLQLQISDTNGKHIGKPIFIQLSSSAYAQAAAWVIGAAFALLLVFAIRNTLKRIRASRDGSRENK
jgi:hypothetical protein